MRSKICIEFIVFAESRRSCEFQYVMNFWNSKTVTSTQLQISIMYDVMLLIIQRGKEFVLPFARRFITRFITRAKRVSVRVVKILRIL